MCKHASFFLFKPILSVHSRTNVLGCVGALISPGNTESYLKLFCFRTLIYVRCDHVCQDHNAGLIAAVCPHHTHR